MGCQSQKLTPTGQLVLEMFISEATHMSPELTLVQHMWNGITVAGT